MAMKTNTKDIVNMNGKTYNQNHRSESNLRKTEEYLMSKEMKK